MDTDHLHRTIGAHEAQLDDLQRRVERIEDKLDLLLATVNEARGGWRTLMLIGGLAGAVGALLHKFLPFIFK